MSPSEFLQRYKPTTFYHFTDTRNLPSIRQNGLLPLTEIRRRGIEVTAFGGNDWSHEEDARRGLDSYVHLCFLNEHPMEYIAREKDKRIQVTHFIPVSTAIIQMDGIRFTAEVANKAGSRLLTLAEAAASMDFEVIYDQTDWKNPEINKRRQAAKRYELLVPSPIAIEHLGI